MSENPMSESGNTYLEKIKGILCYGPCMAVGRKDARLLQ